MTFGPSGGGVGQPSTTQGDTTDAVGSTSMDGGTGFTTGPDDSASQSSSDGTSASGSSSSSSDSSTGDVPICGDGIVQPGGGEDCDDAGESPACTDQCTFKGWGVAVLIENDNGDAGGAQVAAGGGSNATVVWHHAGGMGNVSYDIQSSRYADASGTWGGPVSVVDSGDSAYQQIAIDHDGAETAVWHQEDGATYSIYASRRSSAAASWQVPVLLEAEGGGAVRPQVAVDGSGNAFVVWSQDDGASYSIRAIHYDISADTWGNDALLEVDPGDALFPQVVADDMGNAIAVWHQHDGIRNNIRANRYDAMTGAWGGAVPLENADGDATHAQVAVDSAGDAVAVWQQFEGAGDIIYVGRYDGLIDSWEAAVAIDTDDPLHSHRPQVAVDGSGNATVVWVRWDGARSHIYGNLYDASMDTWHGAALLETDDAGNAQDPQVVIDPAGNSIVVWAQDDGLFENIYSQRHDAQTATWSGAELIEAAPLDARNPQLAVDVHGNITAVWRQWDGGQFSIYSNRYE